MSSNLRHSTTLVTMLAAAALAIAFTGCGKHEHGDSAHAHAHGHGHEHRAPHGGLLVPLRDEVYNLEVMLDPSEGRVHVYVLDGHAENFLRIEQPALELAITRDGQSTTASLPAVANAATGESVGDTALFGAVIPLLRGASRFDGVIKTITVRGAQFNDVAFTFATAPAQ